VSVLVSLAVFLIVASYLKSETATAILLGAFFATVGWLYTGYQTTRNARKSHTMTILVQLRNSETFQKHRIAVLARFPSGRKVTADDLPALRSETVDPQTQRPPTLESIIYIANYYEFISVGVKTGDLDREMIQQTLRAILVLWYDHFEALLDERRRTNPKAYIAWRELVAVFRNL